MSGYELTSDERRVLEILGKLYVSQSKNINESTIRKKLLPRYREDLPNTIKSLHSKGLLRYYRSHNYSLTDEGKRVAEKLASELRKKLYGELRILLLL